MRPLLIPLLVLGCAAPTAAVPPTTAPVASAPSRAGVFAAAGKQGGARSWASVVGRVTELPAPPGVTSVEPTGQGLPARFRASGALGPLWARWRPQIEAAGFRVVGPVARTTQRMVVHLAGPGAGRGSVVMSHANARIDGALDWVVRPVVTALATPCVVPPARAYRLEVRGREANPRDERNATVVRERRYATTTWVDVDGDGHLDVLVPSVGPNACPHEVEHDVYVMRGSCGHLVGTVRGYPSLAGPRIAGSLRHLTTTREWSVITDPSRPPGPENVATHHTETLTYGAVAGSYIAGPPRARSGICHHCPLQRCRLRSGP